MNKDVHGQTGPYVNLETPCTILEKEHLALPVIDTQNDFGTPEGAHPMPDLETVIPEIITVFDIFRRASKPIIHIVRPYETDGKNVDNTMQEEGVQLITVNDLENLLE